MQANFFEMIEFKSVGVGDRKIFEQFYPYRYHRNAESSFGNLCAYSFLYSGEYAIVDNCLVTRVHYPTPKEVSYHYPFGFGDCERVLDLLIEDARENNLPMSMVCRKEDLAQRHRELFEFEAKRDFFDYLYLREDLQYLKGRKYQAKRNHINKFSSLYNWTFSPLRTEDMEECMCLEELWLQDAVLKNPNAETDYQNEKRIIRFLIENMEDLGVVAAAVRVEGKIVAFSLGSSINNDTFDVHIEKADRNFEGAFAIINQQMAEHLPQNFKYINREEDLGLEGLRKAKLSYHPYMLIEKDIATLCPNR